MSLKVRRVGRIALSATLAIVTFSGVAIAGLAQPSPSSAPPPGPSRNEVQFNASSAAGKITVAVVLGKSGSDAADLLGPYNVLASSPNFAAYTIADSKAHAPLNGGIWIAPDYTFTEAASGAAPKPDLIVVPAVNLPFEAVEQGARHFISDQYAKGAHVLGICAGSRLLAASGVLDGLSGTSHWSRIAELEESHPDVSWVRGQRYVQDGRVTTTGAVSSGIPGALKVMADMAGAAEAARVGELISYPGWSSDSTPGLSEKSFGVEDIPVLINAAFPWGRPTVNIELSDGVDELDAAALFEVYTYSQAATTRAVSATGTVRSRHGLTLRTEVLSEITGGETVAAGIVKSHSGMGGFDAAFEHLALSVSPSVMDSVGKMLEYPLTRIDREQPPAWQQWRSLALLGSAAVLAVAAGSLPLFVRRMRRRRSGTPTSSTPSRSSEQ